LPWQRILRQNSLYLGLCKRYLQDFCVYGGVFRDRPSNAANRIFPPAVLVAMAAKFGTKMCYDKQHVSTYLQPFSHYTSQYQQNNVLKGYPFLTPSFERKPLTQKHEILSRQTKVLIAADSKIS